MHLLCPQCGSRRVDTADRARKAGSAIGTLAGVALITTRATVGAEAGAVIGSAGGPVGIAVGSFAGAVIATLLGGTAGCMAGAKFGQSLDQHVFSNCRCMACGYRFSYRSNSRS